MYHNYQGQAKILLLFLEFYIWRTSNCEQGFSYTKVKFTILFLTFSLLLQVLKDIEVQQDIHTRTNE